MNREFALGLACLGLLVACFDDPDPSGTGGDAETETGDGDGDGDGDTGDGDGDAGDGDGDMGDGDGDTSPCEGLGCPCDGPDDCLDEHMCVEGVCADVWCGDGEINNQEPCDDGNDIDGDGCDSDCTFTELQSIGAGLGHTCVLIEGGGVRCWGWNVYGQLGQGNTEIIGDDELPSSIDNVPLPGPAIQLAVGDEHTCAVLDDNQVRCWGLGEDGRTGYGNTENVGDDEFPTDPVDVGGPVEQVGAAAFHSCARLQDGAVRCWGRGDLGRLGYADTLDIGDDELPASAGNVMVGAAAVHLAIGGAHSCAVGTVGVLRCWGRNEQGQLGYGNLENIGDDETPASAGNAPIVPMGLAPNTKVEEVSLGVSHSCARFETGDVLCWGSAVFGEIGTGSTNALGDDEFPSSVGPIDLPGPAISIGAGGGHSCAVIEGGEVYCWGANTFGELGYGSTAAIGDDESPAEAGPVDVGAPSVAVAAGFFHTCVITETNEVRCWGNNDAGQLGLGNTDKIGDNEVPNSVPTVELF